MSLLAVVALAALWIAASLVALRLEMGRFDASVEAALAAARTRSFGGPDGVEAALARARQNLDRMESFALPIRLTPWLWGLVPARGSDLRQVGSLITYSRNLIIATEQGSALLVSVWPEPDESLDVLRALEALQANRDRVSALEQALSEATQVESRLDAASLSPALRDRMARAREARELIGLAARSARLAVEGLPLLNSVLGVRTANGDGASHPALPTDYLSHLEQLLGGLERDAAEAGHGDIAAALDITTREFEATRDQLVWIIGAVRKATTASMEVADIWQSAEEAPSPKRGLVDALNDLEVAVAGLEEAARPVTGSRIPVHLLDGLATRVRGARLELQLLAYLLGSDQPRRLLILGQDDEELRPGGGFIGTVWEASMQQGRLLELRVLSSYDVDKQIPPERWMPAPADFMLSFGSPVIPFRDQNWWPDFRYSAARLRETYERGQGVRPDIIVAVDQQALEAVLAAVGPITLKPASVTVTAGNLRSILGEGIPAPDPADTDPRRTAAMLLGRALLERILGGGADPIAVAGALRRSAQRGDVIFDAETPAIRVAAHELGWDGAVPEFEHDGLYFVESNAYAGKLSRSMVRDIHHRVVVEPDGRLDLTTTITIENPLGAGSPSACVQLVLDNCYWAMVRLFVPGAAEVHERPAAVLPEGAVGPRTGVAPRSLEVRQAMSPEGHTLIEIPNLVLVSPGERERLVYRYRLGPTKASEGGDAVYSLKLRRQPGMARTAFALEVVIPPGGCVVENISRFAADEQVYRYGQDLENTDLKIKYRAGGGQGC